MTEETEKRVSSFCKFIVSLNGFDLFTEKGNAVQKWNAFELGYTPDQMKSCDFRIRAVKRIK